MMNWKITRRGFLDGTAAAIGASLLPSVSASSQKTSADGRATGVAAPINIGSRRELFVDRLLVDKLQDACFKQGVPVPREPALSVDRPWEGIWLWPSQGGMFHRSGYWHLYYSALQSKQDQGDWLCHSQSQDGIHWEKPNLGVSEWNGSKANNIVQGADGGPWSDSQVCVFLDPRPEVPESERIKALKFPNLSSWDKVGAVEALRSEILVSADGSRFKKSGIPIQLTSARKDAFDGFHIFWSEAERRFVGFFRWYEEVPVDQPDTHPHFRGPKGAKRFMRTLFTSNSEDLIHWSEGIPMTYGNTPLEEIYRDGAFPYFRAPHIYVATANRFFDGRKALSAEELETLTFVPMTGRTGQTYDYSSDCNDTVLMSVRPGSTVFTRLFMEAFVRPGPEIAAWTSRNNYSLVPMYQTGPDEMSFLLTCNHMLANPMKVQRFSLRLDGLASINAPYSGGEMVTVPLIFSGDRLELNYATSAAGQVQVEVQDSQGKPFPGFTLEGSKILIGDRIAGEARWKSGADVGALQGKTVRLRFVMRDADLYSLRFFAS